jgi:hypothetical protein
MTNFEASQKERFVSCTLCVMPVGVAKLHADHGHSSVALQRSLA